jgi:cytochrome b6-f complex iron-sulfur subunit
MPDDPSKSAGGVLGRLPKWPRKALNNSVISAEQAYRQRTGLPLLTDADIEALKAGVPMSWESGDGAAAAAPSAPAGSSAPTPAAPAVAPPAPPAAVAPPASATPAPSAATSGAISPEIAAIVAAGKKWSKSAVAAEQARRQRKGLPALTDAEVTALLGEPAAAAPAPGSPAAAAPAAPARPAAAPAAPTAPARPMAPAIARTGASTSYVGTPAVGTSKAAAAGGVAATGPANTEVDRARRRLVWSGVGAFLGAWFIAFFRFFLPRTLFEPNTVFKIGYPSDYALGVDTKWQQKYRIWVDRTPDRLFVIYARCTHLGCTPDWKPSENKFKCPCHGSGYDSEGINFEGPAPRPMDRAKVELSTDGQIQVDVSKLYQWPKGQPTHFNDPGAYLNI